MPSRKVSVNRPSLKFKFENGFPFTETLSDAKNVQRLRQLRLIWNASQRSWKYAPDKREGKYGIILKGECGVLEWSNCPSRQLCSWFVSSISLPGCMRVCPAELYMP